ncbi:Coiled-coil domain-containing 79, partial, partial [Pelobates cultripes]
DACEYFREVGGLMFVSNLAKSCTHSIVKEASLFTLGVLAENNVYCQQTLCTLELFEDVCATLSKEDSSLNLKRMSVYVLLVLVSNNKCGQNLARESGCIDMLLLLFREILIKCNRHLSSKAPDELYQLWTSVCSALCACVNNPQNDENQKLCSSAFPQAKDWLQKYAQPEVARPICSLVGLTVANNSMPYTCI